MKSNSILKLCLATMFVFGVGSLISRKTSSVYASTLPVAFTAEYVVTTHNSTGIEIQNATSLFAQKGDGSHVVLQKTTGLKQPSSLRRILDTNTRRMVTVDPNTLSVTTYYQTDADVVRARKPPLACDQHTAFSRDAGSHEKVFGFEVARYSGKMPGADHAVVRWLAPDLNCFVLREEVTILPDQSTYRRTTTSITVGEPDPSLFHIPTAGYVERLPSEVLTLARQKLGLPANPRSAHAYQALDKVYRSKRQLPK